MHTDLWNFALGLYARPGVESACLELQAQGADVCLLLCAAWLDQRGISASDERERQLRQLASPWQREVVQPLRTVRQQWRSAAADDPELALLRDRVKAMELEAERLQLQRLERLCDGWPDEAGTPSQGWLSRLAPETARHHGALQRLRAAIPTDQDAEDGV